MYCPLFSISQTVIAKQGWAGHVSALPFGRRTLGHRDYLVPELFLQIRFSVATLFWFVVRFASVRIEDTIGTGLRSTTFKELPASLFFLHNLKKYNKIRKRSRNIQRRIGGAQTAVPKSPAPSKIYLILLIITCILSKNIFRLIIRSF